MSKHLNKIDLFVGFQLYTLPIIILKYYVVSGSSATTRQPVFTIITTIKSSHANLLRDFGYNWKRRKTKQIFQIQTLGQLKTN